MKFTTIKKIANNFFGKEFELPQIEDVLYVFLFIFSITFGALLFGIGEQMKKEITPVVNYNIPSKLERDIKKMVAKHPMEKMAPYIAKQDREVAAYLVAIAKKESNWGKYSPQKNGKSCYNYWGYRGSYNQTRSGYSCFASPKQAVDEVGGRMAELIDQDLNTPQKMVVWKCGRICSAHDPNSVNKWIQDVDLYYNKFF